MLLIISARPDLICSIAICFSCGPFFIYNFEIILLLYDNQLHYIYGSNSLINWSLLVISNYHTTVRKTCTSSCKHPGIYHGIKFRDNLECLRTIFTAWVIVRFEWMYVTSRLGNIIQVHFNQCNSNIWSSSWINSINYLYRSSLCMLF